jgi:2,3-bisphosphoglycerate-independent phosphoglycerate mutase
MSAPRSPTSWWRRSERASYDAIVCNYANGDMVGHTGNLAAATRAIEVLDECLGRVVEAMRGIGGEVLITADHGNAETCSMPNHSRRTRRTR